MAKELTIVHIASECSPFAKIGGLGDVVSALPKALSGLGHNVSVIMPFYGCIKKQDLILRDVLKTEVELLGKKYYAGLKKLETDTGTSVFFVDNEQMFGKRNDVYGYEDDGLRFLFFNLAGLTLLDMMLGQHISPFDQGKADIIHCHDWHAGLIPQLLHCNGRFENLKDAATAFTIHNLAFQGSGNWGEISPKKYDLGKGDPTAKEINPKYLNFTRRAILHTDVINTVSERYAVEILTPKFGHGLDKLLKARKDRVFGIINGVDYEVFNPQFDRYIYEKFDADTIEKKLDNKLKLQAEIGLETDKTIPLIGMVNRLTEQKGFELMMQIMPNLLRLPLQLVVVGSGDRGYLKFFRALARKYPDKISVCSPFTEEMAAKVYAASDMYLMPSRFEPCGISQLISLRYGSVPIVHETGGLHDTITDFDSRSGTGNGFTFSSYTREDFLIAVVRALENYHYKDAWRALASAGMKESFSWDLPAQKYLQLYQLAIKKKKTDDKPSGIIKKVLSLVAERV
jgi:starch synthase